MTAAERRVALPAQSRPAPDDRPDSRPAPEAFEVLAAKLAPPRLPPGYVERQKVMDLFDAGAEGRLTLVSAGPGWGKTMSAAAWTRRGPITGPVAWVSLDQGDDEPRAFWAYVLAALRRCGGVPSESPLAGLVPGPVVTADTLRQIANGLSQLAAPVVLVLDDLHEISNPGVLDGVSSLLRHPIPQLRLVLLTRMDPPLALHRLRVSAELCEIRARDLAFGTVETAEMLAQDGLQVDGEELSLLLRRTEGWATGVRLAALYLRRSESRRVSDFAGDDRTVSDYLVGEVLAGQSPELRRFLLRTSVVERMSGGLADAITETEDGGHVLDWLVRANAFVVALGDSAQWYRYHPLLRELLQHQLQSAEPELVPALHERAARWLAAHGHPLDGLRQAAKASAWPLFGQIMVNDAGPLLISVERESLGRILASMPSDPAMPGAERHLCAASRAFLELRYDDVLPELANAQRALDETSDESRTAAEVMLWLFGTVAARVAGDMDLLIEAGASALRLLDDARDPFRAADGYRAVALGNLGTGLLWCGRLEDAEHALRAGLRTIGESSVEAAEMNMLAHLGLICMARGRLGEAANLGNRALAIAAKRGWTSLEQTTAAYLTLALVHLQWNDLDQASELIELGVGAHPAGADRTASLALRIGQARILVARGRSHAARELVSRLRREAATWQMPAYLAGWLAVTEAEIDLSEDRPDAAREHLGVPAGTRPAEQHRVLAARSMLASGDPRRALELVAPLRERSVDLAPGVEARVVIALAADRMRDDHEAVEALREAVVLAEKEGLRRPFVAFAPDRLPAIIERLRGSAYDGSSLVDQLLADVDGERDERSVPRLTERLTDRELTVLGYLPTLMSNAEIAEQMSVSPNTVKAHLKTLYRKLGASSRRQAVQRAHRLELLPERATPRGR